MQVHYDKDRLTTNKGNQTSQGNQTSFDKKRASSIDEPLDPSDLYKPKALKIPFQIQRKRASVGNNFNFPSKAHSSVGFTQYQSSTTTTKEFKLKTHLDKRSSLQNLSSKPYQSGF
jgi:hypothetical protein